MTTVSNSVNAEFLATFKQKVEEGKTSTEELRTLFDDNKDAVKDAKKDSKQNNSAINNILKAVVDDKKNKDAVQHAADKADKMKNKLEKGKEVNFMGYPVTGAKADKNGNSVKVTVEIDGKKHNGTITYAADGSCVMELNTGNETIKKVVDENGVTRQKTVSDKDGKTTVSEYDKSGKINKKVVTDANNKDYKAVTLYDDNGNAARKVVNDGVNTTTKTYEYNEAGEQVGAFATVVNNETKEQVSTKATIIDGNTKTTTETKADGSVTVCEYTREDCKSDWKITNKSVQKPGVENASTYEYGDVQTAEDGTVTRTRTAKLSNGKEYNEVQTLDANGKVVDTKRYTQDDPPVLVRDTATEFDANGNKTSQTQTRYNKEGNPKDATTTTYDAAGNITGQTKKLLDGENVIRTEDYTFNADGTPATMNVTYTAGGKEFEVVHTFREDGSVATIEDKTNGITTHISAFGTISGIVLKDASTEDAVKGSVPKKSDSSSIPLFDSEGVHIGDAKYKDDGSLDYIDWQLAFKPAE